MGTDLALTRLLQLASPALPVGAYSYSQGLEAAIEAGTVYDTASTERWIGDVLAYSTARLEAPLWWRLHAACRGVHPAPGPDAVNPLPNDWLALLAAVYALGLKHGMDLGAHWPVPGMF